jgi:hypothetical protein
MKAYAFVEGGGVDPDTGAAQGANNQGEIADVPSSADVAAAIAAEVIARNAAIAAALAAYSTTAQMTAAIAAAAAAEVTARNAAIAAAVASGSYTPVVTYVDDPGTVVTPAGFRWHRVGNVVFVCGLVTIAVGANPFTLGALTLPLPAATGGTGASQPRGGAYTIVSAGNGLEALPWSDTEFGLNSPVPLAATSEYVVAFTYIAA